MGEHGEPVVEGKAKGDTVYLNDMEFEISVVIGVRSHHPRVSLYNEEETILISGDWRTLRNEMGLELPRERDHDV